MPKVKQKKGEISTVNCQKITSFFSSGGTSSVSNEKDNFVVCPVCEAKILKFQINQHLDNDCSLETQSKQQAHALRTVNSQPSSTSVDDDFETYKMKSPESVVKVYFSPEKLKSVTADPTTTRHNKVKVPLAKKLSLKRKLSITALPEKVESDCVIINEKGVMVNDAFVSQGGKQTSSSNERFGQFGLSPRKTNANKLEEKDLLISSSSQKTPEKQRFNTPVNKNSQITPPRSSNPQSPSSEVKKSPGSRRPYYLDNFTLILKAVLNDKDDGALFNSEDRQVMDRFFNLTDEGQKLYVRMFQRKLKWYQASKIDYPDIADNLETVVQELFTAGLVTDESSLNDLPTVLNIMQLAEMKMLMKTLKWSNGTKAQMTEQILKNSRRQRTIFALSNNDMNQVILRRAKNLLGKCFKVDNEQRKVFIRALMLYSLTSYTPTDEKKQGQQELLTLLFVSMGKFKFPDYYVLKHSKIFRNRDDLIEYETAYQLELDITSCMELGKWMEAIEIYESNKTKIPCLVADDFNHAYIQSLPEFLRRYSSNAAYVRFLSRSVEVLERSRKYEDAVKLLEKLLGQNGYHLDYRGHWAERLALNLEHLQKCQSALKVITTYLADPHVNLPHKLNLYTRAMRICKSSQNPKPKLAEKITRNHHIDLLEIPKIYVKGQMLPSRLPGQKSSFLIQDSQLNAVHGDVMMCSVEGLASEHYKEIGFEKAIHGESSTFTSIYCLLFWTIIYQSGIPDVFRSPHQIIPLDMNTTFFYAQRKSDIDERLKWIRSASIREVNDAICVCWATHNGELSLVNWNLFHSLEEVEGLVECVGTEIIAGICERLAKNYRPYRSGFPDLVVWSTESKLFKVVEVKGPNDRLSSKQILWLDYLLRLGVSAEVCHVTANEAKKLQKVKRLSDDTG